MDAEQKYTSARLVIYTDPTLADGPAILSHSEYGPPFKSFEVLGSYVTVDHLRVWHHPYGHVCIKGYNPATRSEFTITLNNTTAIVEYVC